MSESSCVSCGREYTKRPSLLKHYRDNPEHKPSDWHECPMCGNRYGKLGNHWAQSGCSRPKISQEQREIITGLLMGDGTASNDETNTYVSLTMINEEFLEHVDDIFDVMGCGVRPGVSADDRAESNLRSGFDPNADEHDYSDQYVWLSRAHPGFNEYRGWYGESGKIFPENINMTYLLFTYWYVCDGWKDENRIKIGITNERDRTDRIKRMFRDSNLPEPLAFDSRVRDDGTPECDVRWSVSDSYIIWNNTSPPPGFEYKWPEVI